MSTQPLTPEMQRALDVILMGGGMGAPGPAPQQPQQPPSRGRRIFGGIMDALRVGMDAAASPGDGAAATFGAVTGALDKRDARRQQQQNFELQQMYKQSLADRSSALTRQGDARTSETERHNKASEGTAQKRAETAAGQLDVSKTRDYGQYVRDSVRDGYTPVSREEYESGNIGVPQALGAGQLSAEKQANIARTEQQAKTSASQAALNDERAKQVAPLAESTIAHRQAQERLGEKGLEVREQALALARERIAQAEKLIGPRQVGYLNTLANGANKFATKVGDLRTTQAKLEVALERGQRTGDWSAAGEAVGMMWEKMLDQNSVVRESEFQRVSDNQALIDRLEGSLRRVQSGGLTLTPENYAEIVAMARELHDRSEVYLQAQLDSFRQRADMTGIPGARDIVVPPAFNPQAPGAPPTPGPAPQFSDQQIDEAIRRAGGDPSNPAHRAAALNEMKRRSQ